MALLSTCLTEFVCVCNGKTSLPVQFWRGRHARAHARALAVREKYNDVCCAIKYTVVVGCCRGAAATAKEKHAQEAPAPVRGSIFRLLLAFPPSRADALQPSSLSAFPLLAFARRIFSQLQKMFQLGSKSPSSPRRSCDAEICVFIHAVSNPCVSMRGVFIDAFLLTFICLFSALVLRSVKVRACERGWLANVLC